MHMLEPRVIDLEIRYSHQEDYLRQLNDIVVSQQKMIERLEKEILDLKRSVNTEHGVDPGRSLRDDKPPHY